MSESLIDVIFARRSIRRYTAEPVDEKDITTLLEAAMAAPSASNIKPWHFVVVTERKMLDALAEVHPHGKMLFEAALCIAVCGEPAASRCWVQDCSAATENLLLAVTALGLGGVWLGVHPREERVGPVRQVLGIGEDIIPLNLLSIGHPAEQKESRTQYDEKRVHYGRW